MYLNRILRNGKYISLLFIFLILSCSENYKDRIASDFETLKSLPEFEIIYPADSTIFPPEIVAPTFRWADMRGNTNNWIVIVSKDNDIKFVSNILNNSEWKPDSSLWEMIKGISVEEEISVNIVGVNKDNPADFLSGSQVNIITSKDSVDAPIFYRAVPLPFFYAVNNQSSISWRLGDISSNSESHVVIENLPVCGNCHSFSSNGKYIGMDVDYANDKGSYFISEIKEKTSLGIENIITWSDYRRDDGQLTFGLLSQISPNGRYALSTVKDRSIFVPKDDIFYSQLFFPIKGIVCIYDSKNNTFKELKGADDPKYVQSNPTWSPDGKYIIFAKSPYFYHAQAERSEKPVLPTEFAADFIEGRREFKYDLYKIPFNDGKGGKAVPLEGASNNGKSNYFPKFSPDGKWIVFTKADNFMLLQPDAKLYIMPANGGKPCLMKCNTTSMNSWHSWSPNGKWMVFSSKLNGAYTQLYLTHIDENGIDSPPVYLENLSVEERAANIPEFVNIPANKRFDLVENFLHTEYYANVRADMKARAGDIRGAFSELDRAIEYDPDDFLNNYNRARLEIQHKNYDNALKDLNRAIELKSDDYMCYYERAYVEIYQGKYKKAITDLNKTISLNSKYAKAYFSRGIARYYLTDYQNAIIDFTESIKIDTSFAQAFYHRGLAQIAIVNQNSGCEDFRKAMDLGYQEARQALMEYCR
jgi:hypothetical protein